MKIEKFKENMALLWVRMRLRDWRDRGALSGSGAGWLQPGVDERLWDRYSPPPPTPQPDGQVLLDLSRRL